MTVKSKHEDQMLYNQRVYQRIQLRDELWKSIAMCHLHGMITDAEFQKAKKRYVKAFK